MTTRHPHHVRGAELEPTELVRGAHTQVSRVQLGAAAGGRGIGTSLCEIPPGKKGWPFHFHAGNEEALYILAGRGRLRLGEAELEVEAGDYVALPPGPEHPHQLRNDSDAPLRYLCISTMNPTDIAVYPDSGKIGVFAGAAPGGPKHERFVDGFVRLADRVDYWDGEPEV